ncbi:MAG TPA: hypothetical protein VJ349_23430, partial [Stellaceae bacterium]|nr:hypothetical protein [Stellaceae bacterium]
KTAVTCAARIPSRTSSGSPLNLKKPRISLPKDTSGMRRRDRASSGTQVEQSILLRPTGRAAIKDALVCHQCGTRQCCYYAELQDKVLTIN